MAGRDQKALTLPQLTGVDPDGSSSSRDTCGWISGRPGKGPSPWLRGSRANEPPWMANSWPERALTCHPGQRCAVDSVLSLVGCCWTPANGACRLSTRCLEGGPRSDARDGGDAARTLDLVCQEQAAPYCKTDVFASDSKLDGFSLLICGTDRRTETAFRFTVVTSTAPSSSIRTETSAAPPTSSSLIPSLTASISTSLVSSLGSNSASSPPPPAQYPASPFSASPLAIAGAILGSVGQFTWRPVES
ncbi:hypothetical protein XA68_15314 [Ophiocordyceps unilateralis]|uniref:Uncharacterized protein n=1 Tax=Ophiocordyceps unilateralis TaxID=268505 RepID=A0A2A9P8I9_OPHUN|nr:hypothetical protein XA68_15314 [Ophiocordyceps unilateralis]